MLQPDKTRQYWFHALNHSTWAPGARWTSESAQREIYLDGEIVAVEAPTKLVHTMHIADGAPADEAPSTVEWDITPMGGACRLHVVNSALGPESLEYVTGGWEIILSGLKTLLETGTPLVPEGAPASV